jgi:hypothetical protein
MVVHAGQVIRAVDAPPAVHAFDSTTQTNLGSAFAPGSPDVSLTFTAPTSGRVMVVVSGGIRTNGSSGARGVLAPEIREDDASGNIVQGSVTSVNAWTNSAFNTSNYQYGSRVTLAPISTNGSFIMALRPGRTYFARLNQFADGGATDVQIRTRSLTVAPIPLGHVYASDVTPNFARASDRPAIPHTMDTTTQLNITAGIASRDPGDPEVVVEFLGPNSGRALIVVGGGNRDNSSTGRIGFFAEVRVGSRNGPLLFDPQDTSETGGLAKYFRFFWSNSSFQTTRYQYGNAVGFLGEPSTPDLIPGQRYFAQVFMVTSGGGTTDVFNREVYVIPLS